MEEPSSLDLRSTIFIGVVTGCFCFCIFKMLTVFGVSGKSQEISGNLPKIIQNILIVLRGDEFKSGVIAGLIAAMYSYIHNLYEYSRAENEEIVQNSKKLAKRCINLIEIHNKSQGNPWLHRALDEIVSVHESSRHRSEFLNQRIKDNIDTGIHGSQKIISEGERLDSEGDESDVRRRHLLLDIIDHSIENIKAVTSTDPAYLESFWQNANFSQAYLQANLDAARRGVLIQRIFILPESILSGTNHQEVQVIKSIVEPMLDKFENLKTYCIPEESLSPSLSIKGNQNFLIIDSLFTSMSFREKVDEERAGYLTIAKSAEVASMSGIFDSLFEQARPANAFQIFS